MKSTRKWIAWLVMLDEVGEIELVLGYCASWSVKLHDENQTREGGDACGWSGRITRETKKTVNVVFRLYTFASQ